MATGDAIGCFGLTESDAGSDPGSMKTHARARMGSDWVLNGSKMWITNGTLADVAVVWAQTDDGIRGFAVPTDTKGFSAHKIQRKLSLRASVTAELAFDDLRLPADAVFPEVRGLKGPLSCLNEARYGIVWGVVGAARACLEESLAYTDGARAVRQAARVVPAHPAQARADDGGGQQRGAGRLAARRPQGRRDADADPGLLRQVRQRPRRARRRP